MPVDSRHEYASECEFCEMRRYCRGEESCEMMLESFVEEERQDWYEAWFEYIGPYAD